MKVVINVKYGGFGLSVAAQKALIGKCEHMTYSPKTENSPLQGFPEYCMEHDGQIVNDDHRRDEARTCPALISVLEEMGDGADGQFAELKVVEIPDGVDYEIQEYDGLEHIAERHRTWT